MALSQAYATVRPGDRLGEYIVEEPLPDAVCGNIRRLRARNGSRRPPAVLKVCNQALIDQTYHHDTFEQWLRWEGRVLTYLHNQKGIAHLIETVENPFGLIIEFISGQSLYQAIFDDYPSRWGYLQQPLVDVCLSLSRIHSLGLIYADLKPENILVDPNGSGVLIDFGMARLAPGPQAAAAVLGPDPFTVSAEVDNRTVFGTASYASPEQLRGYSLGPQSDVFSLAATVYATLAKLAPFPGATEDEVIRLRDRWQMPAPLKQIVPPAKLPAGLSELIDSCLEIESANRPQTAAELARALAGI